MLILLYKTWTPTASIRAVKAETDKKSADKQTTVTLLRMRRGFRKTTRSFHGKHIENTLSHKTPLLMVSDCHQSND